MFLKKSTKFIHSAIKMQSNQLYYKQKYYFMQPPRFDSKKDYYKTLGVNKDADQSAIKRQYYKLAKIYHPDHNKGTQNKFKEISQAYQVLSDKSLRTQYDQSRVFGSFTSNFGRKAQQGNFRYQSYKDSYYHQFSQQQQEMIRQQMRKMARNAIFFGIGLVLFSFIFLRSPNHYYQQVGGRLIPVDPHQVASMNQYQNSRSTYGSSYGGGNYNNYNNGYIQPQNPGYGNYNQGYNQNYQSGYGNQYSTTPYVQAPYVPPNQSSYNTQNYSPNAARNPQGSLSNPNMQSNYSNRSGAAPSDI